MFSKDLLALVRPLGEALSQKRVNFHAEEICSEIGFEFCSTVSRDMTNITSPDISVFHNYPKAWERIYYERCYFSRDPANSNKPFDVPLYVWGAERRCEVFESAQDFSINNGVTCSVRGAQFTCSISFASTRKNLTDEMLVGAQFVTPYLANSLIRTNEQAKWAIEDYSLSIREAECLRWVSVGKTSWEISVILSISERTVLFHLANAKRKLKTCNRAHSVAKASMLGLLEVDLSACDQFLKDLSN